jgi:hypothetical protein
MRERNDSVINFELRGNNNLGMGIIGGRSSLKGDVQFISNHNFNINQTNNHNFKPITKMSGTYKPTGLSLIFHFSLAPFLLSCLCYKY